MLQNFEVLAPVGTNESLKSAINCGADAIYLGVDTFNARANIQNFSVDDLEDVCKRAHLFGVKVYLALNILFKDSELLKIDALIKKALSFGVDAFIIQDIGLFYYLKHIYPKAILHASTQMGICNLQGAKFIEKLGFERVVLSRETTLDEIKNISQNTNLDIEYFVQGALCVSFSGNCYLCSLLAESSGNRGKCKQFCRLPYNISSPLGEKNGYLLSAKDFCMLKRMKELAKCGVKSFKIEGRARRPVYVGQAVKVYKECINKEFNYQEKDIENLMKVFNRGNYIEGYFDPNQKIIYSDTQNHIGIEVGHVVDVKRGKNFNEIFILSTHELKKGDAVKFFDNNIEIGSMAIFDVKKTGKNIFKVTGKSLPMRNAKVNLIVDKSQEEIILSQKRRLQVKAVFEAEENKKAKLTLLCQGVKIVCESDEILENAKNYSLTEYEVKEQVAKLGEDFVLDEIKCQIGNVFMAKSRLNELRRKSIEKLKDEIIKNYNSENKTKEHAETKDLEIELFDKENDNKTIFVFDEPSILKKHYNKRDFFVYNPSTFDKFDIEKLCAQIDGMIYLNLPVMAKASDIVYLKRLFDKCENLGLVANNYYALSLTSKEKTIIGMGMNVFNSFAVKFYSDLGYDKIILSCEKDEIETVKNNGVMLFSAHRWYPEYMNFAHCPVRENYNGTCQNCLYNDKIKYHLNNKEFILIRKKIISCQFVLKDTICKESIDNFMPYIELAKTDKKAIEKYFNQD